MKFLYFWLGCALGICFIMTFFCALFIVKGFGAHVGQEIGWSFGYALIVCPLLGWWARIMPPPGREDWLKSN